jgi:hypothetical protein
MFKAERFSTLNAEQQVKVLKEIEKEPFFEMVRVMMIIGMFSNPEYGGNHDQAGWKLIGFEDQFFFKPPFGHYDAEVGAVKNGDAELCAEGSIQDQTLTSTF